MESQSQILILIISGHLFGSIVIISQGVQNSISWNKGNSSASKIKLWWYQVWGETQWNSFLWWLVRAMLGEQIEEILLITMWPKTHNFFNYLFIEILCISGCSGKSVSTGFLGPQLQFPAVLVQFPHPGGSWTAFPFLQNILPDPSLVNPHFSNGAAHFI